MKTKEDKCNSIKDYYKKNDRAYRKFKKEFKSKSKCEICGENRDELLEFDHIDKNTKVKLNFRHQSVKRLKEEYAKCRVLCIWCHRLHTKKQLDKEKEDYEKTKLYSKEEDEMELDDLAKKCMGDLCNGKKRHSSFFYFRKSSGKPRGRCKNCQFFSQKKQRQANQDYVNKLKIDIGKCEFCNIGVSIETVRCFDFDHIKQEDKTCAISDFVRKNSDKRKDIDKEVKKCRLLCCNCHKIRTGKQLKYT